MPYQWCDTYRDQDRSAERERIARRLREMAAELRASMDRNHIPVSMRGSRAHTLDEIADKIERNEL